MEWLGLEETFKDSLSSLTLPEMRREMLDAAQPLGHVSAYRCVDQ